MLITTRPSVMLARGSAGLCQKPHTRPGRGASLFPVSPSSGTGEVALHPAPLSPSPCAPLASAGGDSGTCWLWLDERHSLVLLFTSLARTNQTQDPHPESESRGQPAPASEALSLMHLLGKYLSTASPLCPLLEGERGARSCSIGEGRLGKGPSPLEQSSV